MVNEKLIVGTLASVVERTAIMQTAVAGLTKLIVARVPGFSEQEVSMLESGVKDMLDDAELQKKAAESLTLAIQKL